MPIIFCSKKLSNLIGLKTRQPSISIDNWNGHIFYLEGRKCLVFAHKETQYSFVIFDILKNDMKDFKKLFIDNYVRQLQSDGILTDKLKKHIDIEFKDLFFSTTDGDKSAIGFLNDCIQRLTFTWDRNGKKPTIIETKKYVDNYYNENILLSKNAKTPKELISDKYKNYR